MRPLTALRYLSRQDVAAVLPGTVEQIDLVQETYLAMAAGRVEQPPKPGIHPRPDAFIHAMPVYLADQDVAALKWVSGYPENRDRGLPYISGLVIVDDPATGVPLAIMDAVEITAARTAAASGVCIRRWAPPGWRRAAILGCGEQGRYHATMLRVLNPEARIAAVGSGREPGRRDAGSRRSGRRSARGHRRRGRRHHLRAHRGGRAGHPDVGRERRRRGCCCRSTSTRASAPRSCGRRTSWSSTTSRSSSAPAPRATSDDWPQPDASAGEALRDSREGASVVCCDLGVGALDAAFAGHVLRAAGGRRRTRPSPDR